MGFRFRKSFKIAPGVKVNIGKKSVGMSIGGKRGGISFNSKSGTRARASIPGTGISYSAKLGGGKRKSGRKKGARKGSNFSTHANTGNYTPVCLRWWYIALIVVFAIGGFGNLGTNTGAAIFGIAVAVIMGFFSLWVIIWGVKGSISHREKNQPEAVVDESEQSENIGATTTIRSNGEDLQHLTADGDLPYGWIIANAKFTDKIGTEYSYFLNVWLESRNKSPRETYTALKSFVLYMNDAKKLCHGMGECFERWLEICFTDDYLDKRTEELNNYEQNFPELEAAYEKKTQFERNILPHLEKELLRIIKEQSGILQKDIYKMFDPIARTYIQEKLYYAEKAGKITREKNGNTYKLFIK